MPLLKANTGFDITGAARLRDALKANASSEPIDVSSVDGDLGQYFLTYGFEQLPKSDAFRMEVQSFAGFDIAHFHWQVAQPKAEVLVVHGLFDHTGLFLDLVEALLLRGFNVRSIDLPGHGLSGGAPVTIESFAEYANVIDVLLQSIDRDSDIPLYAVGQSTGCAALLHYLLAGCGQAFTKVALLAPLIQPHAWPWVRFSYFMLHKFMRWYPRSFMTNSHDSAFCDFLRHSDPLQSHKISVKWVGAMRLWIECFAHLSESEMECLVVQGTGDTTVNWKNNISQVQEKLPNSQVAYIEGAMHHLVKEGDAWQKQVFERVLGFLDK